MHWRGMVERSRCGDAAERCGDDNRYVAPPAPKVTVEAPVQQTVTPYLEATGNTASVNSVKLVARVKGFVQEIKYQDGAAVKRGTVLFVIEPEPYKVSLQQAQAAEAGAKASLVNAEAEFARQQELQAKQVSTQANLDKARANRDTARAQLLEAQANVQTAEINLGYTQVTAPFDGVVTARKVSIGELVGGDQPNQLATIVQLHPIWVWFNVSERDVQRVRADLAATRRERRRARQQDCGRGRPADRDRLSAQRTARLCRSQRQPVDRHAAGARHLRQCRRGGCCRAILFGCGCRCAPQRRCWCRKWRWAATRAAATCSRSMPTTSSSSAGCSSARPSVRCG